MKGGYFMENIIAFTKATTISIVGYLSIKLGILAPLLTFLVIAMTMDYISGIIAASVNGELNSKRGVVGILKKLGYIFCCSCCITCRSINCYYFI